MKKILLLLFIPLLSFSQDNALEFIKKSWEKNSILLCGLGTELEILDPESYLLKIHNNEIDQDAQ